MAEENQTEVNEQPEPTLNFVLTHAEANLVLQALGELPAKVSIGVIQKIQGQAMQQLQPQE